MEAIRIMIERKTKSRLLAGVTLLLTTGLLAVVAESQFGFVDKLATRFLGPPQVKLTENFKNDSDVTFDHSKFHGLLEAHVDKDGWVDYAAIQMNSAELDAYLTTLAAADPTSLGRDERLAFLINSYNAFTLKLIVENYPLKSIKDIPGKKRWDAVRWDIAGHRYSLNQIEHELIRPNFAEPRIHFALVCAAAGCPPLRSEAFTGEKLELQLAAQTEYVHGHETWLKLDTSGNRLALTKLYKWYGDDFKQTSGSVVGFIRENTKRLNQAAAGSSPRISWLDYDWSLNEVANKAAR